MELVKRNRGPLALPVWGLLLCLLVLAGCSIPEEGFRWKLWGFETHAFIVGDEEINMRLDTSGFGRYEVTLEEGTITVLRDGETIGSSAEEKLPITRSPGVSLPGMTLKIGF